MRAWHQNLPGKRLEMMSLIDTHKFPGFIYLKSLIAVDLTLQLSHALFFMVTIVWDDRPKRLVSRSHTIVIPWWLDHCGIIAYLRIHALSAYISPLDRWYLRYDSNLPWQIFTDIRGYQILWPEGFIWWLCDESLERCLFDGKSDS